jgi:hypothetical protein
MMAVGLPCLIDTEVLRLSLLLANRQAGGGEEPLFACEVASHMCGCV